MSLYQSFVEKFSHIRLVHQIQQLLEWDYQTYMPSEATQIRAQQVAYMAGLAHNESTSDAYRGALEAMIDMETEEIKIEGLNAVQRSNLVEWAKDLKKLLKLPKNFIKTYHATLVTATEAWKKAKGSNNFSHFSPWLEKIVALSREKAELLGYVDSPYDALIDLYEPGMTSSVLSDIFTDLADFLSKKVKKVDPKNSPYAHYFNHTFSREDQIAFGHFIVEVMGIPGKHARLDCAAHPFCVGIHPTDVRLTSNLEGGLLQHLFAVLHEGGHALYELGLPQREWNTPAGWAASLGLHESQSRWWEVMIGKSLPFWKYMYPTLQEKFPLLQALSLTDFYRHINHIQPSCIRIYADEVTYPLHIILRFEIEKQLIEGSIEVSAIPDLWRHKMETLLGIVPKNDQEGCLQDIHWSEGLFGYFPTYALGTIYAAQYFSAFVNAFPDWESQVASGSFAFIKDWLQEHIYRFGRMHSAAQSMQRVTGYALSLDPYKSYITQKYKIG